MAGDPFKHVAKGDRVEPNAVWHNAASDAARAFLASRQAGNKSSQMVQHEGLILVRNQSGFDADRFDVLGIKQPVISRAQNQYEFENHFAADGEVPQFGTHDGRFVITQEPIKDGEVGKAFVHGVTVALVHVTDTNHKFADIDNNNIGNLLSGDSGAALILWKPSGTGLLWCFVRLAGGGSSIKIYRVSGAVLTQNGWYTGYLQQRNTTPFDSSTDLKLEDYYSDVGPELLIQNVAESKISWHGLDYTSGTTFVIGWPSNSSGQIGSGSDTEPVVQCDVPVSVLGTFNCNSDPDNRATYDYEPDINFLMFLDDDFNWHTPKVEGKYERLHIGMLEWNGFTVFKYGGNLCHRKALTFVPDQNDPSGPPHGEGYVPLDVAFAAADRTLEDTECPPGACAISKKTGEISAQVYLPYFQLWDCHDVPINLDPTDPDDFYIKFNSGFEVNGHVVDLNICTVPDTDGNTYLDIGTGGPDDPYCPCGVTITPCVEQVQICYKNRDIEIPYQAQCDPETGMITFQTNTTTIKELVDCSDSDAVEYVSFKALIACS